MTAAIMYLVGYVVGSVIVMAGWWFVSEARFRREMERLKDGME